jgi:hypothetical protein
MHMLISVINHTNGKIGDEQVQETLRAINRQIKEDFEPYWSMGATLRLEGKTTKPDKVKNPDLRGDAIIYLWDQLDVDDALGYHDRNFRGIPYSFVFYELTKKLGESWTVTLSHEALEMIADPEVNLLSAGPHPKNQNREALYWYEVCDAVQGDTYLIDGVEVSNFVLPLYFTSGDEYKGRNDFLGKKHGSTTLTSFGVNPGGYMGYVDPTNGKTDQIFGSKDAKQRFKIKEAAGQARRAARYLDIMKRKTSGKKSK